MAAHSPETNPLPTSRDRILWLDNTRALGIFMVVFIHTGRFQADWFVYIFAFFMPLFFFLSGLFVKDSLKRKALIPFLQDKALRRLVPYFVFNLLSYLFWAILILPMRGDAADTPPLLQPLVGIFYGIGGFGWLAHNVSLWFLACLFVTEVAFYFLIRLPSKRHLSIALVLCSIVGYGFFVLTAPLTYELAWIPDALPYRLPWCCDLMLTAVVFYGTGYLARPYVLSDRFRNQWRWGVMGGAFTAYVVATHLNPNTVNFILGKYGNFFWFYVAAFGGIFFWLHLSQLIKPAQILTTIGQSSLTIYLLHLITFPLITGVLTLVLKIPDTVLQDAWWVAVLYTVITIVGLIPVHHVLNQYLPWLVGRRLRRRQDSAA